MPLRSLLRPILAAALLLVSTRLPSARLWARKPRPSAIPCAARVKVLKTERSRVLVPGSRTTSWETPTRQDHRRAVNAERSSFTRESQQLQRGPSATTHSRTHPGLIAAVGRPLIPAPRLITPSTQKRKAPSIAAIIAGAAATTPIAPPARQPSLCWTVLFRRPVSVEVVTVAVFVMIVPIGRLASPARRACSRRAAGSALNSCRDRAVPPTAECNRPAADGHRRRTSCSGTTSDRETFFAVSGPLLVTVRVYVMFPAALTGSGASVLVTANRRRYSSGPAIALLLPPLVGVVAVPFAVL